MTDARDLIRQASKRLRGKRWLARRERLIARLAVSRIAGWLQARPDLVAKLATHLGRYRWLLRPLCARRNRHKGTWSEGVSTCRTCGLQVRCGAPPGTLLTNETGNVLRLERNGQTIRRLDKFQGTKKDRRRNRAAVQAAAAIRERYTGGDDVEAAEQAES